MADELPSSTAGRRELAARIVAAYVRQNEITADQMPSLIATVHQALVGLANPQPIVASAALAARATPPVSAAQN